MSLTRKDFKEVAGIIKRSYQTKSLIHSGKLINELCNYFKQKNQKFNEDKFKEACLK